LWYGFFLLLIPILGEGGTFLAGSLGILSAILLPRLFPKNTLPPAKVNEDLCTGCTQCYLDCPYMAIEMVPRPTTQKREEPIAKVYDDLCVRCGICIGSCAPMFMGPPKRSGRDQLLWIQKNRWDPPEGVLFRCGIGTESIHLPEGVLEIVTDCSGGIHTTTIETLLRKGVKKIGIVPCPERDCKNRFGVRWLKERIFSGREAELSLRVDRERILLLPIGPGEGKKEEEKIVTFFLKKNEEPLPPPEEIQCEPKPFPKKRRWLPI
jgi:ferredoxin/coenzyme F420-reducing hydrogenase delta subunit